MTTYRTGYHLTSYPYTAERQCDCMGCTETIEPGDEAVRFREVKDGHVVAHDYHAACQYGPAAVSA